MTSPMMTSLFDIWHHHSSQIVWQKVPFQITKFGEEMMKGNKIIEN